MIRSGNERRYATRVQSLQIVGAYLEIRRRADVSASRQGSAEVTLAGRTGHGDDQLAFVFRALGHVDGGPDVCARRNSGENAFFLRETTRHCERVIVGDLDALDNLRVPLLISQVEVLRNKAGTGTLDLVRTRLDRLTGQGLGDYGRILWLDGDGLKGRFARLDEFITASDGAAGADRRHQDVNLAGRVVPDFFGRGRLVNLGVGRIFELLGNPRVGRLLCQLLGPCDGALHSLGSGSEDERGPEHREQRPPLQGHGLRHREGERVPLGGRDKRQRDAGIAARRLDDHRVLLEHSALLRVFDHRHANTVLHAPERIEELALQQDRRRHAGGDPVQADERGAPDGLDDVVVDATGRHPNVPQGAIPPSPLPALGFRSVPDGTVNVTLVPLPGAPVMTSLPPRRRALSRMARSPRDFGSAISRSVIPRPSSSTVRRRPSASFSRPTVTWEAPAWRATLPRVSWKMRNIIVRRSRSRSSSSRLDSN